MLCVRKTRTASVASDPSVCTKSARASLYARRNATQKPIFSSARTGTTSPNAASQTRPGRMKKAEERERQEHEHAARERASDGDRPLRRERYGADVRDAGRDPPAIGTTTSSSVSSRTRASKFRVAGGTPSASEGQKRRP